jgi:8-amino-7-oxononanoate synthase
MDESPLRRRVARELDSLRHESQYRSLEIARGINLCSNDYLGLSTDPRLKAAVIGSIKLSTAVGATGSRLLSGNSPEWEHLEKEFAEFAGTQAALYFGSGYAANVGLLSSLLKPGDLVFSDALNHASLIDGMRLSGATKIIYPHRDLAVLETRLHETASSTGAKIIVTESLFSMEGDVAPIAALFALARRHGAEVVIDEAHATGVIGSQGRGITADLGLSPEALAIVHTCGKALASAGGFVCGSENLKNYLVNRARTFIFSTAVPPYFAGQIRAALELAKNAEPERAYLRALSDTLRDGLKANGVDCGSSSSQIIPVIFGTNAMALHVAEMLQQEGFAVKAIRPPTVPAGTSRIRISLTAKITSEDVRRLVEAIVTANRAAPAEKSAATLNA